MKRQEQLSQSETDSKTAIKLLQGRDGRDGRDGVQGIKGDVGERGEKGDQGFRGQKGEPAGGVVYVRWGRDSCPSTGAQFIYSRRIGGSEHRNTGGGTNLQCLPLDPNYLKYQPDKQTCSLMYGSEYHNTNGIVPNSHDKDIHTRCSVICINKDCTLYDACKIHLPKWLDH